MNNLNSEIVEAIEYLTDEWRPMYVMAYGTDRAVVIWEDGSRNKITWQEHDCIGEDRWDYYKEEVYQEGGFCVDCIHIDGEVWENSLEIETDRLAEMSEQW